MYPVNPANGRYDLGVPSFSRLKLNLEKAQFEIISHNLSTENKYVQEIKLNGDSYRKPYINHDVILSGGKLEFFMGHQPRADLFIIE